MRQVAQRRLRVRSRPLLLIALRLASVGPVACANTTVRAQPPDPLAPQPYGGAYAQGTATGDTQAGAAFARWVLDQDPQHQYMTDAVVRNEDTLGVKVQPTITRQQLQQLLVSLTQGMARTWPGKPLTVIAFYQSGDKLAQANYDPNTGQVTVNYLQ